MQSDCSRTHLAWTRGTIAASRSSCRKKTKNKTANLQYAMKWKSTHQSWREVRASLPMQDVCALTALCTYLCRVNREFEQQPSSVRQVVVHFRCTFLLQKKSTMSGTSPTSCQAERAKHHSKPYSLSWWSSWVILGDGGWLWEWELVWFIVVVVVVGVVVLVVLVVLDAILILMCTSTSAGMKLAPNWTESEK